MFKLTKKVEFCLIIFKHFQSLNRSSGANKAVRAHEIADAYNLSSNFLAKIMQELCKKKVLTSKQGVSGGYYLNIDLGKTNFLDFIEMLEGKFSVVNCISSSKICIYHDGCNIIDPMRNLNQKFKDFYKNITLLELVEIPFYEKQPELQNN